MRAYELRIRFRKYKALGLGAMSFVHAYELESWSICESRRKSVIFIGQRQIPEIGSPPWAHRENCTECMRYAKLKLRPRRSVRSTGTPAELTSLATDSKSPTPPCCALERSPGSGNTRRASWERPSPALRSPRPSSAGRPGAATPLCQPPLYAAPAACTLPTRKAATRRATALYVCRTCLTAARAESPLPLRHPRLPA